MTTNDTPIVGIVMGSASDWDTMKESHKVLEEFGVPHDYRVLSAHRAPVAVAEYASGAEARGMKVIIGAAGAAAHLAGVIAAHTLLPVLGVPIESPALKGMDSLLATVQMPGGIPVGTLAIGKAGAKNAALLAVAMLATTDAGLREKLRAYREKQTAAVLAVKLEA